MAPLPDIDLASPLQFVINAAAGGSDAQAKREVVEAALAAGGRRGDLLAAHAVGWGWCRRARLYPDLLEDREAYKARFGRSRWVAFVAACATLLRAQRKLRLHI